MKRHGRWVSYAAITLALSACGAAQGPSRSGQEMAVELLEVGIGEARPDVIRPLISDDYRQHNPRVPDGPEGLLGFVTEFADRPVSERVGVTVLRSFEDGEFVVTHSEYRRRGMRISGFDVFRVRGGRLAEHWDMGMRERAPNASGHGLLDGPRPDEASLSSGTDASGTEVTRARVRRLAERGLVGGDLEVFSDTIAETCIQHDPRFGDGRAAWAEALESGDLVHEELVRTIAQGQWALTQSRATRDAQPYVVYDLFRLEGDMVAEHWVVWEAVPERMAHSNGML